MVERKGVGASVAAALIFSSLLLSNFLIFASSEDRSRLSGIAAKEHELYDLYVVGAGLASFEAVQKAQAVVESRQWGCSDPKAEIGAALAGEESSANASGLTVTARLFLYPGPASPDNLTSLAPYDGTVAGALNFADKVSGSSPDEGGVRLSKAEAHGFHLGVELDKLSADCLASASDIPEAISTIGSCSPSVLNETVAPAVAELSSKAAADGFGFSAYAWIQSTDPCTAGYLVRSWQAGIAGPGGNFTVLLGQGGSVSLPRAKAGAQA